MEIEQSRWTAHKQWEPETPGKLGKESQLVIIFGSTAILKQNKHIDHIAKIYPNARLWGCSTAGEIFATQVSDESLVVTALAFQHTEVRSAQTKISQMKNSYHAGKYLAQSLEKQGLVHVMVVSDGLQINGSDLVRGLMNGLPENVTITGGLSGDGERFKETLIVCDHQAKTGHIAVLGLYSQKLKVGYGSLGGWDPFGPERLITKSDGNMLYEMDGKSALELYKKYLGDHAKGLPATGLLFPLSLRMSEGQKGVVRTILSINEKDQSLTFAGDIPEGAYARLMKANFDRLIDGAIGAAVTSYSALETSSPELGILISCVGRKMVLKQRVEEEVEGVRDVLGNQAILTGFYSYGEISPFIPNAKCELHNQTMTITTLSEN